MKHLITICLVVTMAIIVGTVHAEMYSTDFEASEGFAAGGINLQPGTGTLWWENSSQLGSGSIDQEIQSTYVHSGSQAYRISNAKGNQGAILMTGVQLYDVAGETGATTVGTIGTTGFGSSHNQHGEDNTTPVPTAATQNQTSVSYWWRTVSTLANADFGFSAAQTDLSGRRMSYISYYADGEDSNKLKIDTYGGEYNATNDGWAWKVDTSAALEWGQWYHTTEEIIFQDGVAQDIVNFTVHKDDGTGNLGNVVFQAQTYTWEAAYFLGDWAAAGTIQGIDGWALKASNSADLVGQDGLGIVIDDFSMSTVPEPATMCLLGLGGLLIRRKRG